MIFTVGQSISYLHIAKVADSSYRLVMPARVAHPGVEDTDISEKLTCVYAFFGKRSFFWEEELFTFWEEEVFFGMWAAPDRRLFSVETAVDDVGLDRDDVLMDDGNV